VRLLNSAFIITMAFMLFMGEDAMAAKRYSKYRWDESQVIVVENRMGREWNAAVEYVVKGWDRVYPRFKFKVQHRPKAKGCFEPDKIVLCPAKRNKHWSGLAYVEADRHEIVGVSIWIVNYEPQPGNEAWRNSDVVSVWDVNTICHEIGHGLGLDHNNSSQSCLGPGVRQTPGKFDRQSLKQLYREKGKGWP
jgi:hypothetical protein